MLDCLIAVFVTAVALASLVSRLSEVLETDAGNVRFASPDALGVGLLLVGTVSITWRRSAPLAILLITSVAFVVNHQLGYAPPPVPYGPLIALYTLAVLWMPVRSVAVASVLMLGVVPLYLTRHSPITDDQFLADMLSLGSAWALGYGVQLSRVRAELLEEKADQLARERDANALVAVQQERARIARDLHDIVSHHVSVMVAQATAVQTVLPAEPDQGLRALRSIETVGRAAMVEMRRMLGVLQPGSTGAADGRQPGLDQLATLVAHSRRVGLPVDVVVRGGPRPLPAAVDVNAYRIVQEALTNAVKHAGPARAQVLIGYEDGVLRLRIRDDGYGGREQSAAGHGLIGILQRVTLLGGRLSVGCLPDGGFEVAAELPLPGGLA